MKLSAALFCTLLLGCGTVETDQSASLCVGLCMEIKSKVTKGSHNVSKKHTSSRSTDRRDG
jgi:hypothetical protein